MTIARDTNVAAGAFGLGTAPFEAGPDPRFVYAHSGLQRVCAELLAFDLSERPGLFLISGAPGTGKSTLLHKVLEDRRLGARCLALSGAGGLSFEALVEAWCAALGIATQATAHKAKRAALGAHLTAQGTKGGTGALLLDDAEALADGVLRGLHEFAASGVAEHRLAQVVLAGRPELEARLARPDLSAVRRAVAVQTRLQAMAEPEVAAYIRHRLAVAGHEAPDELFSAQAVEIVARASMGVPRLINILCQAALEIAAAGGQPTVSAEQIEAAIQACLLHAQDALAAQDLSPPPGIAAASVGTAVAAGPGPPRPGARWPIVVEIETVAAGVARIGATARRSRARRLTRAALGLLAGLILGLAVMTLYPTRLETPEAVAPGLLLSAEDDKTRAFEVEPAVLAPDPPVEPRALEVGPAVLAPDPPVEPRALEAAPAVLVPKPPVKPRLLPARIEASVPRDTAAVAPPSPEAPDAVAEARKPELEPTSWLGRLAEFFTSAEPPQEPRHFGQRPDR